jgi:hypothetical protein
MTPTPAYRCPGGTFIVYYWLDVRDSEKAHWLLDQSVKQLTIVSKALDYQGHALNMLLRCRRHGDVLSIMLSDSIREQYRYIAFVNETRYLAYLVKAIKHSNHYQGVQRRPVRWFAEQNGDYYLKTLRDQRMSHKTRLFLIDGEDAVQMEEDLANPELMNYY